MSKVKNYIDFMSQAYLFFTLPKYDVSIKKQIINDKKIYSIDTGFIKAIAFQFSEDQGRILENAVFLELKRRGKNIYYYEGECDFLVKEGMKIVQAIQVASTLNPEIRERELKGITKAMQEFKLKEGTLVTLDIEETLGKISIIPLWKFLLEN